MQNELWGTVTDFNVEILGVNEIGHEAGNSNITLGGYWLPWLQDNSVAGVWSTVWGVRYRDVKILNAKGELYATYNLTDFDLSVAANYNTLKGLMLAAAAATDSDNDGLPDAWEELMLGGLGQGPDDDKDKDGATNWQEFAHCSDPDDPASRPAPRFVWAEDGGGTEYASVLYVQRLGNFCNYATEVSHTFGNWLGAPADIGRGAGPSNNFDGTGGAAVLYYRTAPATEFGAAFFRVLATSVSPP